LSSHRAGEGFGGERELGITAQQIRIDEAGAAPPTDGKAFDLRVGIDCGYLYYADGGMVDTSNSAGLAALERALDGRAMDALAERWLAEYGRQNHTGRRRPDWDWSEWKPGQPIAWEDVFESLREDNLHGRRGCYAVFDLYFVDPTVADPEVILHFGAGPHVPTAEVGGVRINLKTDAIELLARRGRRGMLEQLWEWYRRRYPELSHLRARWHRMRELGAEAPGDGSP
jgi:hypothetical protein